MQNPTAAPSVVGRRAPRAPARSRLARLRAAGRAALAPAALASALALAPLGTAGAQPAAEAAALARRAATRQVDAPAAAIADGREALRLLGAVPDAPGALRTRVAAHNAMATAYTTLGRYDSAATAVDVARRLAAGGGDSLGLAIAYGALGSLAQRRGDPERAVAQHGRALAIARAIGADSAAATSLVLLGFIYAADFADYTRGLDFSLEALHVRERLGNDPQALAAALNTVGVVYGRLHQGDRALAHFARALALYRGVGAGARAAGTLSNMGDLRLEQGDPAGALAYHLQSLAVRETVGDRWSLSLARRNLALAYLAMGRTADARDEMAAAMRLGAGTGNRGLAARNLLALAAVERARGRPAAAERAADSARAVAGAMGSRELTRRAWQALAEAQEADGRLAAALASQRRFKAVSDSIFDERSARHVSSLEERYAAERREHEIERLRSAQALSALQARQRATQRNAVAAAALLLLGLGAAAYRRRGRDARRAETLSLTDALTGLRNRRYVRETVARELAEAGRRGATGGMAFLLLDVDHFKQVNDGHGHVAGDRLLVDLARLLEATCQPSDVVVRWGGEEFLVVRRGTDHAGACALAERIRAAVAAHATTLDDGRTLRVTCSVGVAVAPRAVAGAAWGWESVVALADHGTYAAKRRGRDAWVGYSAAGLLPAVGTVTPELVQAWIADGQLREQHSGGAAARAAA